MALVDPIYDCLFRLAQPDALMNEEEVRCISAHEYLKVNFTLGRFFECLLLWNLNLVSNVCCQMLDRFHATGFKNVRGQTNVSFILVK